MKVYLKRFFSACSVIIVPSTQVKELLLKEKISTRIEVVPTGIDIDLIAKANPKGIKAKYKIPENAKLFLSTGRLAKEKNIPFLLDVFAKITEKKKDVYFMIIAEGPERKNLEKLAGERVIFTGKIPQPEIFRYYKAADIFIFASKAETQGLVLSEAKAAGLPIVALSKSGLDEMVEDGMDGFLAEENTDAFSQKVLELLNNPDLLKRMSEKAFENAAQKFSIKVMAQKIEAIYKSLQMS